MSQPIYRKRTGQSAPFTTSVRLSPPAAKALQSIKDRLSEAYPEGTYPSLSTLFDMALTRFATDLNRDATKLEQCLNEMRQAGYPVKPSSTKA